MSEHQYLIPEQDGQILVVPEFTDLPEAVKANHEQLSAAGTEINGRHLAKLRSDLREAVREKLIHPLSDAPEYDPDLPIVMSGHQPEFSHPGIWLKNHLTSATALAVEGNGLNLVVDSDAPGSRSIRFPEVLDGNLQHRELTFLEDRPGFAFEELKIGDGANFSAFVEASRDESVEDGLRNSFQEMSSRLTTTEGEGVAQAVTRLRQSYEADYGLRNYEILISGLVDTEVFRHFVLHIISNSDSFRVIYNRSLDNYRNRHGIRSKANPLPDLVEGELPFWVWKEGEARKPLFGNRHNGGVHLHYEGVEIEELGLLQFESEKAHQALISLSEAGYRIRPRALALTMFCRLLLADIFIHGVGGGKYDTVTDEIIENFFDVSAPVYAVATGTFHLPLEAVLPAGADLERLTYQVRDVNYNPNRYAPASTLSNERFNGLLAEKKILVDSMPGKVKEDRYSAFVQIKDLNREMAVFIDTESEGLRQQFSAAITLREQQAILEDRSYPFFLFPENTITDALRRAGIFT